MDGGASAALMKLNFRRINVDDSFQRPGEVVSVQALSHYVIKPTSNQALPSAAE